MQQNQLIFELFDCFSIEELIVKDRNHICLKKNKLKFFSLRES